MSTPKVKSFLPAYVGSKRRWVKQLEPFANRPMVELFAGSAIISANHASSALLVDTDEVLTRVLSRYDELVVPEEFTSEDYRKAADSTDWWLSAFYLSAMSRAGLWRHSARSGWNVATRDEKTYRRRKQYEASLGRWRELNPTVRNCSYLDITDEDIASQGDNVLVILDPPYEGTSPHYVSGFDFGAYWARVSEIVAKFDVLIFDLPENLTAAGIPIDSVQTLSGLGKPKRNKEAMTYLPAGTEIALRAKKHVATKRRVRRPSVRITESGLSSKA